MITFYIFVNFTKVQYFSNNFTVKSCYNLEQLNDENIFQIKWVCKICTILKVKSKITKMLDGKLI